MESNSEKFERVEEVVENGNVPKDNDGHGVDAGDDDGRPLIVGWIDTGLPGGGLALDEGRHGEATLLRDRAILTVDGESLLESLERCGMVLYGCTRDQPRALYL